MTECIEHEYCKECCKCVICSHIKVEDGEL